MGIKPTAKEIQQLLRQIKEKAGIDFPQEERKIQEIYNRKLKDIIESFNYENFSRLLLDISLNRNRILTEKIINALTVNETYFFRESYQFKTLINFAIPEILKLRSKDTIRILSAPCSTGEEVYSIIILLMEEENLVKKHDFMILGIDIDTEAIKKAQQGIYSERSVHKLNQSLINKYFKKLPNNLYQVKNSIRQAANFRIVNILNQKELFSLGKFDIIFSRNMLIYFDEDTKRKVIESFYSILKDRGILFLGHAEKTNNSKLFRTIKFEDTFFYQKI